MDFKNTAKKFFTTEERTEEYAGPRPFKSERLSIVMRVPKSFSDVKEYADSLLGGSALLISFETVDASIRDRIFDYLNGVSYICNATVSAVSDDMLLYAPDMVKVNKEVALKKGASRSWWG